MEVKLRQIVGKRIGDPHGEDIPWDVDFVMVDGGTVGVIGHAPNAPITFRKRLTNAQYEEIRERVAELRKVATNNEYGTPPPPPPEIDEEDEDDDE